MSKLTPIGKELISKLRKLRDDKEYVIGVITYLESDEEYKAVMDYIERTKDVTPEDVILLSLLIDKERNDENIIIDDSFADLYEIAKKL